MAAALLDCRVCGCGTVTAPVGWPGPREPAWADVLSWLETTDAITHGLAHALSNRALAISATIDAQDPAQPLGDDIATALAAEVQRLTTLLRALRAIPVHAADAPLPVLLKDVAAAAIDLHAHHATLGDVTVTLAGHDDAPPVLVVEPLFVHAMLVTLTALKRFAAPGGVVRITCGGTPDEAQLTLSATRDAGVVADGTAPPPMAPSDLPGALLSAAGLEVEQTLGRGSCSLLWALPSLREARRRAREAAAG